MRRDRSILARLGLAVIAIVVLPAAPTRAGAADAAIRTAAPALAAPTPPHGPVFLPDDGALFGAHVSVDQHNGPDRRTALRHFEEIAGRTMALERVFYRWDEAWPTADDQWSRDQGRTLILSWSPGRLDGTFARWADITVGLYDVEIDARAAAIKAFGAPIVFVFNHEPNNANQSSGQSAGSPEEFAPAYRHIHERFTAAGAANVSFGLVLMAQTFRLGEADLWYPGDAYVDVLGADGYNWYGCNFVTGPWARVEGIFEDFYAYGIAHNKAMILAEWASGEDPMDSNRKANWIREGASLLKTWPEVKGISWYNTGTNPGCPRYIDTSAASLQAFAETGADPYFNPTAVVSITAGPPANTDAQSAQLSFTASRADASFECSLDGAPSSPCTSPLTLGDVGIGPHRLEVRGTDASGRPGNATSWSWAVTGPVTAISSGPPALSTDTRATFSWSSGNPAATYRCALDGGTAEPCTSPLTFDPVAPGMHTFEVVGTVGGLDGPPATAMWTVAGVGASINVTNAGYSPATATVPLGTAARWNFTASSLQSTTDSSGMGLWDSGPLPSGARFDQVFFSAGIYRYTSTTSARTGTIKVPMGVAPPSGDVGTQFSVTWASTTAPSGFVHDVQLKRPGGAWAPWRTAVASGSDSFAPDAGSGDYSFRARLRNVGAGKGSAWSAVVAVRAT